MLISIVVLAVGIVSVILFSQPAPEKIPAVNAIISNSGRVIQIYHGGGDVLPRSEMTIQLDGVDYSSRFLKGTDPGWTTWSQGDSLVFTVPGGSMPRSVLLLWNRSPSLVVLASADFGGGMATPVPTTLPGPAPPPAVSGITPGGGTNGTTVYITDLSGTGFHDGAAVTLRHTGYPDITAGSVVVLSPTRISCTVNLAGAAEVPWDVVVTNLDGQSGTRTNGFTVSPPAPAPTVSAITPGSGNTGLNVVISNLSGTGFLPGAAVALTGPYPAITATNITVASPTRISCSFDLRVASPGSRIVVVTNPDGKSSVQALTFTVSPRLSPPVVSSISPVSAGPGSTLSPVTIGGTGFLDGATVKLNMTGSPDLFPTNVTRLSANAISCGLYLSPGADPGQYNVVATNPDGQAGMLLIGFTVTPPVNPPPSVSTVNPAAGTAGATLAGVTVAGTGFLSGATVKLNRTGSPDLTASAVVVGSTTAITCTLALPSYAATGQWNVVVTNTDGRTGMLVNGFTIGPTVTSIIPGSGYQGGTRTGVLVGGTGFRAGVTSVRLTKGAGTITPTNQVVVSATSMTCDIPVPGGAATGLWDVVITNTDGTSGTLPGGFTVNAALPSAPTVTGISVASGNRGWTVSPNPTISGTGFVSGATVFLNRTGSPVLDVNVVSVTATLITVTMDLRDRDPGVYNVVVTNPDGKSGMRTGAFTVNNPAPTITNNGFTPSSASRGTGITLTGTFTGTGFQPGAAVELYQSGYAVEASSVTVTSSTQITATFSIPGSAGTGSYGIQVSNTDGRSVSRTGQFTLNA